MANELSTNINEITQYIVIRIGEEQYGIDIKYIDNIVRMQHVTRVPKVPEYLKGVINLRGEVIPVMSLRLKMGLEADEITRDSRILILKVDPEEGSGFLKRIMADSYSFYLPKAVKTEMLLNRVQSIVNSRRVDEIITEKTKELRDALDLAANVQRSMLPPRINITETDFYTIGWSPKEVVSGDLFEALPLEGGGNLYVLGDIQGHGVSAALSMMAVQSFLKQLPFSENITQSSPAHIANLIQAFFANNLGAYSYMTALICKYQPRDGIVDWISCGAPDLNVIDLDNDKPVEINPDKRGNLPIGLMSDTVYTDDDVVRTHIPESSVCMAFTDGLLDVYKDKGGYVQMSDMMRRNLQRELIIESRQKGSMITVPYKFLMACEAYGYTVFSDDMTELIFGATLKRKDIWEKSLSINANEIEKMALEIEQWCNEQGWSLEVVTKVQLVFEEKMMNLYDHGYDIRDRAREQACVRVKKANGIVELTIWDCGTPEPSIEVAAGSLEVALELKNREFSGRGRGRLMVREICSGIKRNCFGSLNETIYFIPMTSTQAGEEK